MNYTLLLGKVAGIKLKLHWTFLILLGWIFIASFSQSGEISAGLAGVGFIIALFACVVLHELGHALTARQYGIPTRSIVLLPIGGVANLERLPEDPKQELWVALAGPAVNVVIAIVLFLLLQLTGGMPDLATMDPETTQLGTNFLFSLLAVNVLLVLFNMIPAFPMDGGRVLRALLAMRFSRAQATEMAARLGQMLAIVFVFLGFFYNFWLVFIGLFVYLGAGAENQMVGVQSILSNYTVKDAVMHQFTPLRAEEPLRRAVEVLLDGQEKEFIVVQDDRVIGVLSRDDLIRGLQEQGDEVPIGRIAKQSPTGPLGLDTPLEKVYQDMRTARADISPVQDADGRLVGVLNMENIQELLLLRRAQVNV